MLAVLAEGGGELGAALLDAGLVDRVAFFVAPRLLGGRTAPGPVGGVGRALKEAVRLSWASTPPDRRGPAVEGDVIR